jgi:predicted nucleic acid-binding protein
VIEAVDTSVLILSERNAEVAAWFEAQLLADELAVCDMVRLEYLFGARNAGDYELLADALASLRQVPLEPPDWARALEVQSALARQTGGGQRAVKIPDLLIAAAAERAQLPLVHCDEDYDRISAITGQPTRWVTPRGPA